MKIEQWIIKATQQLQKAGIASAQLDCLLLLEDLLHKNRAHILAHPELVLSGEQLSILEAKLQRRLQHEPLAYIRGQAEFYGHRFSINKYVLQPRPETETLVEAVINSHPTTVIDVGTGSGAIAISVALALPTCRVVATDIDANCLALAKKNAQKLGANTITFAKADLLTGLRLPTNCLVAANLPYVPTNHPLNIAASKEPATAIFGGDDGLDYYRQLFQQIQQLPTNTVTTVVTEALLAQQQPLAQIAGGAGFSQTLVKDLVQVFRAS